MAKQMRPLGTEAPSSRDYSTCRTFAHAWEQFYPTDWEPPIAGWRLSLRCIRCNTERHDIVSATTGGIIGRRYEWPDDYLMVKGVEPPTRDELRAQMFIRLRDKLREHHALGADNVTPIRKGRKAS